MSIATPVFFNPGVGYDIPGGDAVTADETPKMKAYKIPPVVWIFVFLIVGYVGVRNVMEE